MKRRSKRHRDPKRRAPRLLVRFGVLSAGLVLAIGATAGFVLQSSIRKRTIDDAVRTAEVLTAAGVRPLISPADLERNFVPLGPARTADLDETLGRSLSAYGIVRLKLWNRQHWLVYSDKAPLRGRWFPAESDLNMAFAGHTVSSISDLSNPEELEERDFGRLLSVYVPLRVDGAGAFTGANSGRVIGAFEIYLPYQPIARTIRADTMRLYQTLGVGLAALYLGLFKLIHTASRRLRRQAAENRHQAYHDALTGLPNRVLLRDRLEQAIVCARRDGTVVSVLLLDVDRFKEINDALGHQLGDQLLTMIGARLLDRVRAADTIARLGGDEFAILLPALSSAADASIVAESVTAVLEAPFELGALAVDVRASIGVASAPNDGDDADTLLRQADVAMYAAKHAHTSVEAYRSSVDHYRPERLSLAADLRRAIEADELVLHYQPKIEIATKRIVGCEALVRWQHPERGLLAPSAFLPVIETTELIKPLTLHLLDRAMRFAGEMRASGVGLHVAVNLSAHSVVDLRLPDQVADIVRAHGLPFDALELELTESAVLDNPNRARSVLETLAGMGVPISVDDFGTGYASISYLTELPISTLKIDQSFIHDVTTNPKSAAVVSFSLALAGSLDLNVVAEGIEDQETFDELDRLGCQQAQGYLISRPIPAVEFGKFVTQHNRALGLRQLVVATSLDDTR